MFVLEFLGQQVVGQGMKAIWFTLEKLAGIILSYRADDTVNRAADEAARADLVMIDHIGLLTVDC